MIGPKKALQQLVPYTSLNQKQVNGNNATKTLQAFHRSPSAAFSATSTCFHLVEYF